MKQLLLFVSLLITQLSFSQTIINLTPTGGDDKTQIQNALNAGGGSAVIVNLQPRGGVTVDSFRISNTLYFNYNNISLRGDTSHVKIVPYGGNTATAFTMFQTKVVKSAYSTSSVSIHKDSLKSYIIYNNSSFVAGKILQTIGKHKWEVGATGTGYWYMRGVISYISRKSGDTSFLTVNPLETNNDTAYIVYTPITNLRVRGIWVDLSHVTTDGWNIFQIPWVYKASFWNMKFNGNPNITTGIAQCIHLTADSADIQNSGFYNIRPNTNAPSRYAINYEGSNILIHHNVLLNCGDAIENGGSNTRTIHCKIWHNWVATTKIFNGQIGTHLNAFDIDASYNIIKIATDHSGLHVAGQLSRISHNYISVNRGTNSTSTDIATKEQYGSREHNTIDSNYYVFTSPAGTAIGFNNAIEFDHVNDYAYFNDANNTLYGIGAFPSPINDIKIRGNKFWGCRVHFVLTNGYVNTQVTNNTFYTYSGVTPTLPSAASGLALTGSVVITSSVPAPPTDPATVSFDLCDLERAPDTLITTAIPPVVNAGGDQTIQLPITSVKLYGTATDDTAVASRQWTVVSGNPSVVSILTPTLDTTTITGLIAGVYKFVFSATDNGGLSARDTVQVAVLDSITNLPPTDTLTSPVNNTTFNSGSSVTVNAKVNDPEGKLLSVSFYEGTTLLKTMTTAPFQWSWSGLSLGTHSIKSVATDAQGLTAISPTITFNMGTLPAVRITSPTNGSHVRLSNGVNIVASASDADGYIACVDFYANNVLLFSDTNSANGWGFGWTTSSSIPLTNGTKTLFVRAYDNDGQMRQSSGISITVK